jgi:hypothetical protein
LDWIGLDESGVTGIVFGAAVGKRNRMDETGLDGFDRVRHGMDGYGPAVGDGIGMAGSGVAVWDRINTERPFRIEMAGFGRRGMDGSGVAVVALGGNN